jgi:heme-degrading monooxygenase HmoA
MILEIATIHIKDGTNTDFEKNLVKAQTILSQADGYLAHEFQKCMEIKNRYVLLIQWETLEAHTEGFRSSELFTQWRGLIGAFFEYPPEVVHYEVLAKGIRS